MCVQLYLGRFAMRGWMRTDLLPQTQIRSSVFAHARGVSCIFSHLCNVVELAGNARYTVSILFE